MNGPPAIELREVSRWYGNLVAVNNISFAIGPGVTGLLGPNGAGKSTLLHLMSGFLRPSNGRVLVLGAPPWRNPSTHRNLGIAGERDALYPFLTGFEFVLLNARLHRLSDAPEAARQAIESVGLQDVQHRAAGGYSKGMRQRLKLAAAMVHRPRVLLLDEPFNGMDPRQRLEAIDLLADLGRSGHTILISSHILEEVGRLAQNVLVLVAGRLAASGDFHHVRRLLTEHPHTFAIHSSDNRRLASALLTQAPVSGVDVADDVLTVRSSDFGAFALALPRLARDAGVSLYEVIPADESLESVFAYLVKR